MQKNDFDVKAFLAGGVGGSGFFGYLLFNTVHVHTLYWLGVAGIFVGKLALNAFLGFVSGLCTSKLTVFFKAFKQKRNVKKKRQPKAAEAGETDKTNAA